jgi:CelD/BcsL family acetyltransferase involved in cellulose biosynthesis
MSEQLRLEALDLSEESSEWAALAAAVGNVFGTPEWLSTWWHHYGRGRTSLATACRGADGTLVAVLPLYLLRRRPLRVARFLGHGPGDALGPICRSADRADVAATLVRLLDERGVRLLLAENVPRDEGWSDRLGASVVSGEASPVLTLEGATWDELLASWSKSLRYRIRSRERKLARDHEVRYRLADDPERFDRDFDRLMALHRARWPQGSNFSANEPFHRAFAALAFTQGWCRLWLLEVDGEARAAWYGFRFAGVESYYQLGRDPAWDPYSIGFLVLTHSIREAVADGVREYRFLRGGEEFKYRFASHDPGLETIVLDRGRLGSAALRLSLGLPRPLLKRLARL